MQTRWSGKDRVFLEGFRQSATNLGPIQSRLERWFELAMERGSGRYKRQVQVYILVISGVLVSAANVDTLAIAGALYVGAVQHSVTRFPLGWTGWPTSWTSSICGIALTWAALTAGSAVLVRHLE